MADTEQFAKGYALNNDTQYDAGRFLLERLDIIPNMHVLDIGCGTGNLASHIAQLVGKHGSIIGIDPSEERIAIAHKQTAPNLTFYVGRAEDLSRFSQATFDVVFVNSTLHWVQDQPRALRECGRVLKSGGRLGISGQSGDFVATHELIKADVLSRERYRIFPEESPPKFLRQRELERILEDAGFRERTIVTNTIVKSAKNAEAMIDWLDTSSSGKTYGGIPLDLRPSAREEMKQEWEKVQTEQGIRMEIELLVTVATKT
ncbi:MAG: hypothetical protein M1821_004400 [Bathelium mastoideum]|nr:MAG: hypothetical protein M1821_004400 [Bathelium mastoideum]